MYFWEHVEEGILDTSQMYNLYFIFVPKQKVRESCAKGYCQNCISTASDGENRSVIQSLRIITTCLSILYAITLNIGKINQDYKIWHLILSLCFCWKYREPGCMGIIIAFRGNSHLLSEINTSKKFSNDVQNTSAEKSLLVIFTGDFFPRKKIIKYFSKLW